MKKYFMKGTDDELKFGDMIELDFTKEGKDGHVKHHHMECKFLPEFLEMLLENDIIEERGEDEPEDNGPLDFEFNNFDEALDELFECFDNLKESVDALTKEVKELKAELLPKNAKKSGK